MSLNYVTLTCDLFDGRGNRVNGGTATFTPSVQLTDSTDHEIIAQAPLTAVFRSTGSPVISLLATDNGNPLPAGWAWTVTFSGVPGNPAAFSFFLPYSNGSAQNMSALSPVSSAVTQFPLNPMTAAGDIIYGGSSPAGIPARLGIGTSGQALTVSSGFPAWTNPASNTALNTWALDSFTGTDDQKMTSALAAWSAAGNGKIILGARAHTFASQWATTYSAGVAQGLIIEGAGVAYNGAWGTPSAATTCTFTYSGGGAACMDFQHIGTIELTGIQFKSANGGIPLFQTTNATPNIHDSIFSGGGSGLSCATDAIYLGGTGTSTGSGDTAKYNAYAGAVYRNFFDGIRRAVLFQTAANAITVTGNTVSKSCGSNLYMGACIEFYNAHSYLMTGNIVRDNCIEMYYYPVGIKVGNYAYRNRIGPNGFYDEGPVTSAYVWIGDPCYNNVVDDNCHDPVNNAASGAIAIARAPHQYNELISSIAPSVHSVMNYFYGGAIAQGNGNAGLHGFAGGAGFLSSDFKGNLAGWATAEDTGSYTSITAQSAATNYAYTGSIINGSNIVTSTTATFVYTDIGLLIDGPSSALTGVITAVYTPAAAPAWFASSPILLGDIVIPSSPNSHLYQCSTAGTTGSSQPTWPTGGGTVTDGTAVWTDLGTSATAVVTNNTAAATTTGGIAISRVGTPLTMTGFSRHHILSSGSAPAVAVNGGAGSGATASVAGNDLAHTVTVNTGTGTTTGSLVTVTFAISYVSAPRIIFSASNAAAAAVATLMYAVKGTSTYTFDATSALSTGTTYTFDVITVQ